MSSFFIHHSLLLLPSLFLTFSLVLLQTHARESQFFSKTSRYATSPKVSTSIPQEPPRTTLPPLSPQSHIGYGLYGHNPDQFPTATATTTSKTTTNYNYNNNNNVAPYQPNTIPSTFTNTAEFQNKEFNANNNNNNNIPSSAFTYDTEFWDENYKNKEFNANRNIPSSFANTENYENNKEMNIANNNNNNNNNNNIPSGFSNGELNPGNYPTFEKQYGMSDTRVMENGKYFYDVNAEEGGNYEPVKGNIDGEESRRDGRNGGYSYGGNESGYEYKNNNEVGGGYQNNQEKHEENQEEYVP